MAPFTRKCSTQKLTAMIVSAYQGCLLFINFLYADLSGYSHFF